MAVPGKERLSRFGALAGILASLATIAGVASALLKSRDPGAPSPIQAHEVAMAGPGGQVFQDIHGNVTPPAPPSTDPREVLARGGTRWSRSGFDEALQDGGERATGLFLAGGMALDQGELLSFMRAGFSLGMARQLAAGAPRDRPDLCPTAGEAGISFYASAREDGAKMAFIQGLCAGPAVRAAIRANLSLLDAQLGEQRRGNAGREQAISACIEQMHRAGRSRLLDGAARQAFMADLTYTPRDLVESRLSRGLMLGDTRGNWIDQAIHDGCSDAHQVNVVDGTESERWRSVLRMLGG